MLNYNTTAKTTITNLFRALTRLKNHTLYNMLIVVPQQNAYINRNHNLFLGFLRTCSLCTKHGSRIADEVRDNLLKSYRRVDHLNESRFSILLSLKRDLLKRRHNQSSSLFTLKLNLYRRHYIRHFQGQRKQFVSGPAENMVAIPAPKEGYC